MGTIGRGLGRGLDQDEAGEGERAAAQLGQGERGVVDGPERVAGDEEDREGAGGGQIGAREAFGVGGEEAASRLDQQEVAA